MIDPRLAAHLRLQVQLRHCTRTHIGLYHDIGAQGRKRGSEPISPVLIEEVRELLAAGYALATIKNRLHTGLSMLRRVVDVLEGKCQR